jgi:hypothetical protein
VSGHEADRSEGALESAGESENLHGAWKEYFAEDIDIDAILYEICHEWEAELEEFFEE